MIVNVSRLRQFQSCREKAYNWDELRLTSYRDADPLMIGEAYHKGSEILAKVGNIEEAVDAAEHVFRERLKGQMILPEELPEIEREVEFVRHATRAWAQHYDLADFKILWPEVSGMVPLPNTDHHCFFSHRILEEQALKTEPRGAVPTYSECTGLQPDGTPLKCYHPHYFKFRTDGVIEFYRKIWLLEQKTTSSTNRNNFWPKWNMEFQIGCYMYGVWKKTGQRPAGAMINAIIKHFKNDTTRKTENGGYKKKLDPTNVDFERDTFVYTEQMLESFEKDLIRQAHEYETSFANPALKIWRNTDNCFNYNRACYYWNRCQRLYSGLDPNIEGEFKQRSKDYVELSYYELLGLEPPKQQEETCSAETPIATTKEINSPTTSSTALTAEKI